jgi:hypothetical protein
MRITVLAVVGLHLIDVAFFHGQTTAELINTATRLWNGIYASAASVF